MLVKRNLIIALQNLANYMCDRHQPIMILFFLAKVPSNSFNSTGTTVWYSSSNKPAALAFDSSNALYVVESNVNRVQKYILGTLNGTTVAGQANGAANTTSAYLNGPVDVAVDSSGNVYALDQMNDRVQFWANGSSTGTTIAGIGERNKRPIKATE